MQEGDSEGGLEEKGGVAYYESEGLDYGDEMEGGEIVGEEPSVQWYGRRSIKMEARGRSRVGLGFRRMERHNVCTSKEEGVKVSKVEDSVLRHMEYLEAETAKGIGRETDLIYHGPLKAHLLTNQGLVVSSCTPTFFFLHPTISCKDHIVPINF